MSSGLEKIVGQINQEALDEAGKILGEADEAAKKIRSGADAAFSEAARKTAAECSAAREDILKKGESASKMKRRQMLLLARQELIDEVINDAHAELLSLGDAEYFGALKRLLESHALPESGSVCFNSKDLARLPEGFEDTIAQTAENNGGKLVLSDKACDIDGGFLLVYGGIEENCSFDALFAAKKEELRDGLNTFLFA